MLRLLRLAATTIRASSEVNIVGNVLRCSATRNTIDGIDSTQGFTWS